MSRRRGTGTPLANILRSPAEAALLGLREWELLIWQARSAELLGQLRHALLKAGMLETALPQARRHLDIAWKISELHGQAVRFELASLRDSLCKLEIPVILLKGAAYCAQNNSAAAGRVFNDIDILVPKASIVAAEETLIGAGWLPSHVNTYDQRYYREWMHEIPPLEHKNRATVLDVHHAIVAPTSGIRPDPEAMFHSALAIQDPKLSFFKVLGPEEMVIHSASHLFFGEFHKGLRDLYDLHSLFTEFSGNELFWERLVVRAEEMGLGQPVFDALVQSQRLLGTEVPSEIIKRLAAGHRNPVTNWTRNWLFGEVLRPNHPTASGQLTRSAKWLAFARSHHLRMPLPLLIYHLGHKALHRERKPKPV